MDGAGNIEYHQRTRNRDPPLSSLKPQPTELIGHPCVQQGDHWNCSRKFYPSYPWVLEWSLTLTFSPWYWKVIFFVHSPILTSVGLTVYSLTQAQATRQILTLGSWPWKAIELVYSPWELCVPSLIMLGLMVHSLCLVHRIPEGHRLHKKYYACRRTKSGKTYRC